MKKYDGFRRILRKVRKSLILLAIITIVALISAPQMASAQRSIGVVKDEQPKTDEELIDIPIEKWAGHKFVFLEMMKGGQE